MHFNLAIWTICMCKYSRTSIIWKWWSFTVRFFTDPLIWSKRVTFRQKIQSETQVRNTFHHQQTILLIGQLKAQFLKPQRIRYTNSTCYISSESLTPTKADVRKTWIKVVRVIRLTIVKPIQTIDIYSICAYGQLATQFAARCTSSTVDNLADFPWGPRDSAPATKKVTSTQSSCCGFPISSLLGSYAF